MDISIDVFVFKSTIFVIINRIGRILWNTCWFGFRGDFELFFIFYYLEKNYACTFQKSQKWLYAH